MLLVYIFVCKYSNISQKTSGITHHKSETYDVFLSGYNRVYVSPFNGWVVHVMLLQIIFI